MCYNSFHDLDKKNLDNKGVVTAQSWNFGKLLRDSFKTNASKSEKEEAEDLYDYYYEFFIFRIGAVPFKGYGGSVKKPSQMQDKAEWLTEFMDAALIWTARTW